MARISDLVGEPVVGFGNRVTERLEDWGSMQKEILLDVLKQSQFTCHFSFDRVSEENASLRLNDKAASVGFIYRHIGETMNLFGQFFGIPTDAINTTIGQTDNGQVFDVAYSR